MFDMAYSSLLERTGGARPAEQHDGGGDRRIRPHAEDQSRRRPRSLAAMLDHADGRRTAQGRHRRRLVRRNRRGAEGSSGDAGADRGDRVSRPGHRYCSRNCRARRAGRFRWWIAAPNRSGSCSREELLPVPAAPLPAAWRRSSPCCRRPWNYRARSAPATDRRSDRSASHQEDWTRAARMVVVRPENRDRG